MGKTRNSDYRHPLAWQGTLAQMKEHGTRLVQSCSGCGAWIALNIDTMILQHGPEWAAWGRQPACPRCSGRTHFMASPAAATPFRPLLPGPAYEAARKRFLKSFGFTKRDVARIKAMAERHQANPHLQEAALNDLDVPYRVGACRTDEQWRPNGNRLGEWAGVDLLFWRMDGRELEHWAKRRKGPRRV